ncbi:MAG: family 1 encapsulin nanocompartment shell protein, partial [Sphaerochaetaceae bacterium]|nr:family 1 encapsulin nanocompartment shell protein [Sphaerochaetaceae bacterium]
DILKKDLAPLSSKAWEEIEERAVQVLRSRLSARKVVKVNGPLGWNYTVVPEGRLDLVDDTTDVKSGVYRATPLVETRVQFKLNRWELDNLTRGAKDIDYDSLDEALVKLADFEEKAVYEGFEKGNIDGLSKAATNKILTFGKDATAIMESISNAMVTFRTHHYHGPLSLVVGQKAWVLLNKEIHGIPLIERIERLIGNKVILSLAVEGAFLLPYDDENLELTIGQDFAIGYESHDSKEVRLFATESFAFRVLDPTLIVKFSV